MESGTDSEVSDLFGKGSRNSVTPGMWFFAVAGLICLVGLLWAISVETEDDRDQKY